jgi:hypothetical protein
MVGVPSFSRCDSGPSSRMIWLICFPRSFWMNQGATKKHRSIAVIVAMIARNGEYLSTLSALAQAYCVLSG